MIDTLEPVYCVGETRSQNKYFTTIITTNILTPLLIYTVCTFRKFSPD